jgi:hypothetical protein
MRVGKRKLVYGHCLVTVLHRFWWVLSGIAGRSPGFTAEFMRWCRTAICFSFSLLRLMVRIC